MIIINRQTIVAVLILMVVMSACEPKEPPLKQLLPNPGAQSNAPDKIIRAVLDKSPLDMIYYPEDYPIRRMSGSSDSTPIARVIYSRPEKDGRVIFGNVVKYGEPWRLGANEATEIEFFIEVMIQKKKIKKGRYVLYCIPSVDTWKIILNKDLYIWGLKIPAAYDEYSFDIPVVHSHDIFEVFTIEFKPDSMGMQLGMAWDNVKAELPISY